jgi:hypothetical protein
MRGLVQADLKTFAPMRRHVWMIHTRRGLALINREVMWLRSWLSFYLVPVRESAQLETTRWRILVPRFLEKNVQKMFADANSELWFILLGLRKLTMLFRCDILILLLSHASGTYLPGRDNISVEQLSSDWHRIWHTQNLERWISTQYQNN